MSGENGEQTIRLPLDKWVREIARTAAREAAALVIADHLASCPTKTAVADLTVRVRTLQIRFAGLVGLMLGSGIAGGGVAVGLAKLFGG
ncbi:MAG TPA: hypothetical protein VFH53_10165 [Phycisphaerae bacterium]|nr:hypothetical protein [Phycisphaerae bacterium]